MRTDCWQAQARRQPQKLIQCVSWDSFLPSLVKSPCLRVAFEHPYLFRAPGQLLFWNAMKSLITSRTAKKHNSENLRHHRCYSELKTDVGLIEKWDRMGSYKFQHWTKKKIRFLHVLCISQCFRTVEFRQPRCSMLWSLKCNRKLSISMPLLWTIPAY